MFNLVLAISRDSSSATIKMCKEIAEKVKLLPSCVLFYLFPMILVVG